MASNRGQTIVRLQSTYPNTGAHGHACPFRTFHTGFNISVPPFQTGILPSHFVFLLTFFVLFFFTLPLAENENSDLAARETREIDGNLIKATRVEIERDFHGTSTRPYHPVFRYLRTRATPSKSVAIFVDRSSTIGEAWEIFSGSEKFSSLRDIREPASPSCRVLLTREYAR